MMNTIFTSDFTAFFTELEANNHKEWFDANKKRFENSAKKPFAKLVQEIIEELRKAEPEFTIEAKDCIFRINRDVRFSKDKSPYKMQVSAHVAPKGRKDMQYPGLYLELSAKCVGVYGGVYMPEKESLTDIRWHIANHLPEFKTAYTNPSFIKAFGTIQGEKNKKLDAALVPFAEKEPLIYNKQFYYHTQMPADLITSPNLKDDILSAHNAAMPVREFLREALI